MAPIAPISAPKPVEFLSPPSTAAPATGFQQVLDGAISNVMQSRATANNAVSNFMSGGTQELHTAILATQQASLSFDLLMQVRNKVVAAYDEVMKMQI